MGDGVVGVGVEFGWIRVMGGWGGGVGVRLVVVDVEGKMGDRRGSVEGVVGECEVGVVVEVMEG